MRPLLSRLGTRNATPSSWIVSYGGALGASVGAYGVARLVQLGSGAWLPLLFGVCAACASGFVAGLGPGLLAAGLSCVLWSTLDGRDGPPAPQVATATVIAFGVTLAAAWARRLIERTRAQAEALSQREAMLQSIFDGLPAAILVIDLDGRVAAASAEALRVFRCGCEGLYGRPIDTLIEASAAAVGAASTASRVEQATTPGGERLTVEVAAATADTTLGELRMLHVRDVGEAVAQARRVSELQEQLVTASRLMTVGELGSAIAHELNQPLTAAVNFLAAAVRLAEREGRSGSAGLELLPRAQAELLRAGEILRGLRAFFTRSPPETTRVDLPELLREAVLLAAPWMRERAVQLVIGHMPSDIAVLADGVQVRQVVLNLVRNASDALADVPNRRISLEVAVHADEVVICVKDTGAGIAPEVRARLFRPFNTSKPEGMGVGLSICRTIVEAHGGRIWCETPEDGASGTVFCFSLPKWKSDEGHVNAFSAATDHHH